MLLLFYLTGASGTAQSVYKLIDLMVVSIFYVDGSDYWPKIDSCVNS